MIRVGTGIFCRSAVLLCFGRSISVLKDWVFSVTKEALEVIFRTT